MIYIVIPLNSVFFIAFYINNFVIIYKKINLRLKMSILIYININLKIDSFIILYLLAWEIFYQY